MDTESEKNLTEDTRSTDDFNRTIVLKAPERRKGVKSPTLHKLVKPFRHKKMEVGDIIGHVDMSHYTDVEPDTTANLTRPLSKLDTRYSVLEEFAKGGHATLSPSPGTRISGGSWPSNH